MTAMSSVIGMLIVISRNVYDSNVLSDWNAESNKQVCLWQQCPQSLEMQIVISRYVYGSNVLSH